MFCLVVPGCVWQPIFFYPGPQVHQPDQCRHHAGAISFKGINVCVQERTYASRCTDGWVVSVFVDVAPLSRAIDSCVTWADRGSHSFPFSPHYWHYCLAWSRFTPPTGSDGRDSWVFWSASAVRSSCSASIIWALKAPMPFWVTFFCWGTVCRLPFMCWSNVRCCASTLCVTANVECFDVACRDRCRRRRCCCCLK